MEPREIEIPAPWGKICGKWHGPESNEPIVFLHGWQDNMGSFDTLIPLLPPGLSYFTLEFPGHGQSSHKNKGEFYYIFWDGLLTVRRVVKYMGWPKISIVGHSLGGAVGFLYAASYPDQVDKLVCLDIACPRVSKPCTLAKNTATCVDKFLEYETLNEDMQPCYEYEDMLGVALDGYKGSVTRQAASVLMERGIQTSSKAPEKFVFCRDVRLKVAGLGMPSLDIVKEYATRITCDYLNIRAKDGLPLESPEIYPMVLDWIKQSARSFFYHEVPGSHHVHLNEPETVAPIIANFLLIGSSREVKMNGHTK